MWFFFSSRRRHTRCSRDWSSDVCSSDLHRGAIFLRTVLYSAYNIRCLCVCRLRRALDLFPPCLPWRRVWRVFRGWILLLRRDRKSTRLNSSHGYISYAVFCLKKKKNEHLVRHHREQHRPGQTRPYHHPPAQVSALRAPVRSLRGLTLDRLRSDLASHLMLPG